MKRSLFIAIAVLIVMALFVGCKAEIADRDELVEVTIDGGARAISTTGTSTVQGVESLYWYYIAEKNDNGRFSTGATTWKAVSANPGLAGASLGKFSTGFWKFSFYGYTAALEGTDKPADPAATAIYMCTDMSVKLDGTVAAPKLTVKLDFAGEVSNGVVTFGAITFEGSAQYKVEVFEGTAKVAESEYVDADQTTDIASMTPAFDATDPYEFDEGVHTLTIKVYEKITENNSTDYIEYIVSEDDIIFTLQKGITITISGSAEASEVTYVVSIDGTVTQASVIMAVDSTAPTTVEANITPAESGVSSVTFPAGSLANGNYALDMEVSGAAADFTVSSGIQGVPVAGISLNLTKEDDDQFSTASFGENQKVTVTTYIPKGLVDPKVYYGNEEIEVVNYEPSTGELIFKTPHFSEFVVVAENIEAINLTQNKAFASLSDAIEWRDTDRQYVYGDTVLVLKDCELTAIAGEGFGPGFFDLYKVKLDLGGHTVTVNDPIVVERDVTISNGNLLYSAASDGDCAIYAWKNHNNIVLKDVSISSQPGYCIYVMSGASVVIDGGVYDGCVGTNGQDRNVAITINSGVFKNGCYFPAHGTYTINDGVFEDLVEIKSGTLTINGGSFTCGSAGEAQYIAYENGNAIHNAALGAVAYNGNLTADKNYGPTPIVNINGGTFNGSICVARKTADIDYPTVTFASGLDLPVVELGVIPANN